MTPVFISYHPGSKGKFITEVCDLARGKLSRMDQKSSAGNAMWMSVCKTALHENGIYQRDYHGIYPEEEKYKFYIDSVLKALKSANAEDYAIDIHYTKKSSLEYLLEKGAKVIRIIANDAETFAVMHNHFFYKNFIEQYGTNSGIISEHARRIIKDFYATENNEIIKEFIDLPLSQWNINQLRLLFDLCRPFTTRKEPPGIITHPNLIEFNVRNLLEDESFKKIVDFVDGKFVRLLELRIKAYKEEQQKIKSFEEYIEEFLKKHQQNA